MSVRELPRYRMFDVKYIGATNTRGARVKITDLWWDEYIYLSRNHNIGNCFEQGYEFLKQFIPVVGTAGSGTEKLNILLSDDYCTRLKVMKHEHDKSNT
jgi:hypothetical protein